MRFTHGAITVYRVILLVAVGASLITNAACNSSSVVNQKSSTSVSDARLYGVGGVSSAGFPESVQVFQGSFSASTTVVGGFAPANFVTGVAVDPTDSTGAVYVSDGSQVLKFSRPNPNATAPTVTVPGVGGQLNFDSSGNLFVLGTSTVYVIKHPITSSSVPQPVVNESGLIAFAVDASNNLDVLSQNTSGIQVLQAFVPPYTGAPISTSNVPTGAVSCVFDASAGLVFLDNDTNFWTYPLPLTPNEAPSAKINIQGVASGLTFDSNGNSFLALVTPNPNNPHVGGSVVVANPPFTGQAAFTFATPYSEHSLVIGP